MDAEELAAKLANHENRLKVSEHRIDDLEESQKQIYELTISVKELALSVKGMVEEQKEQGKRIDKLESEPAEKWKFATKNIAAAILGAVGGVIGTGILALIASVI